MKEAGRGPKKYHPHPLESIGFFLNVLEYVDFWEVGVVRCGFPITVTRADQKKAYP